MGKLTTHVLDTANGRPGAGIRIELFALSADLSGDTRRALKPSPPMTMAVATPLCWKAMRSSPANTNSSFMPRLFRRGGAKLPEPRFVDRVVLRFGIADAAAHYHVPLLVSPWSYSTYRGS